MPAARRSLIAAYSSLKSFARLSATSNYIVELAPLTGQGGLAGHHDLSLGMENGSSAPAVNETALMRP